MIDVIKPLIKQFLPFAQERMGFDKPPRLFVRRDEQNAQNPLGKTAYYDPSARSVTLYISGRHPKDVMRSLSHELVHHTQNCNGEFDNVGEMGDGYAQNDSHLREMERQAYEIGNLCFRDWEDSIKHTIYFEHLQKGVEKVMSTKNWKNGELKSLLSEAWGFKMDLSKLNENTGGSGVGKQEDADPEDERRAGEEETAGDEDSARESEDGTLEEKFEAPKQSKNIAATPMGSQQELRQKCMRAKQALDTGQWKIDGSKMHAYAEQSLSAGGANPGTLEQHQASAKKRYTDILDSSECRSLSLEESKELYEMGGCADHGPEDEVVVMQSADEEGPDDPNAIVDELGDLVSRLQAALGGAMGGGEEETDMVVDMGMMQERIKKALRKALKETGSKDTGASKGDKGKDEDDPEARDYEHGGDRKGDESETHPGTDYSGHHPHHKTSHGDDGEEEKHYRENAMSDEEHIKAIEHHLDALRKDRDYDEEREEELEERRGRGRKGPHIRGAADPRLREAVMIALKKSIVKKKK